VWLPNSDFGENSSLRYLVLGIMSGTMPDENLGPGNQDSDERLFNFVPVPSQASFARVLRLRLTRQKHVRINLEAIHTAGLDDTFSLDEPGPYRTVCAPAIRNFASPGPTSGILFVRPIRPIAQASFPGRAMWLIGE